MSQASLETRRGLLKILGAVSGSVSAIGLGSCRLPSPSSDEREAVDWPEIPWGETDFDPDEDADARATKNVRTLMNILIPPTYDDAGKLVSPGALETGAFELLSLSSFVPAARNLGLVPDLPAPLDQGLTLFDAVLRGIVSADLDVLAFEIAPFTPFSELVPAHKRDAVARGFEDPLLAPFLHFVRATCFIAFLGAVYSDAGLQALGFPPFENFDDRLAVSGYPRTKDGRLLDLSEDLATLDARGMLDDYTYNREPIPTDDDDLQDVLDIDGDLF